MLRIFYTLTKTCLKNYAPPPQKKKRGGGGGQRGGGGGGKNKNLRVYNEKK